MLLDLTDLSGGEHSCGPPIAIGHGDVHNVRHSCCRVRTYPVHLRSSFTRKQEADMLRWGKRDSVSADKWAPLAPSAPSGSTPRFGSVLKPSKPTSNSNGASELMVGRWPETVLLRIVSYLPIPDLPAVSRVNRSFARIVRAESGWEARCTFLRIKPERE